MPQTAAAKKALRVSQKKRVKNDRWRRRMREALHAVRDAITAGGKKDAQEALVKAESVMERAARRNVIHGNKAARQKSRLQKTVNNLK